MKREFYFCPPDFLELSYSINPWMDTEREFSRDIAKKQHQHLIQSVEEIAPRSVKVISPKEGLTELCFLGDSVFAYQNKALFARFSTPERYPETEYVIDALAAFGLEGDRVPPDIYFEGSGETMIWRDKILVGYGVRSSREVVHFLESYFDTEVIGFELTNPRFHHLDTALFPVSENLVFVCRDAVTSESLRNFSKLDCEILTFSEDELEPLALNNVVIEDTVIVDSGAARMQQILITYGFNVRPVNTSEFIKFGASVKCLTFQHYF